MQGTFKNLIRIFNTIRFIFSGSDDHAIRIWKNHRSEPLRNLTRKEEKSLQYNEKLIERYKDMEEVRRIDQKRHVPRVIKGEIRVNQEQREALERRERNKLRYSSKKGTKIEKSTAMRKHFLKEEE
jgi:WD repeat and SOF domain-containing protein 1